MLPILLGVVGIVAGFGASTVITKKKLGSVDAAADQELKKAKKEADESLRKALEEAAVTAEKARRCEQQRRKETKDIEIRFRDREASLDKKLDVIDKRAEALRKSEEEVEARKDEI